jgi:hypothetical protein
VADESLNRWREIASTAHVVLMVTRLEDDFAVRYAFATRRLGVLHVLSGAIKYRAARGEHNVGSGDLVAGDSVRLADVDRLTVRGEGIALLLCE